MGSDRTKTIVAQKLFDFREIIGDRHLIVATVDLDLEPILLSLKQPPDYRTTGNPNQATFPKKWSDRDNDFRIHYSSAGNWFSIDLPPTKENFHEVQPLGINQWIVVRGRSSSMQDSNAHVYGSDGTMIRSFPAGDGINDVQTTTDSKIWISYFDEGVFGDTEMSRNGLVCMDQTGQLLFNFDPDSSEFGSIDDCYALNVASDHDTWVYYYSDFPIVRLKDRAVVEVWKNVPLKGSSALAASKGKVWLAGSYDERAVFFPIDLDTMKYQRLTPVDQTGTPLSEFRTFARAHCFFLQTENSIFKLDLRDFD